MMLRRAVAAVFLALAACSSGGEVQISREVESGPSADSRPPEKTAGYCDRCHFMVFDGHRCGLTTPCELCQRECGARHLHQAVWRCDACDVVMSQQHVCNNSKSCTTCRRDRRNLLGTKGCTRCYAQVPPVKLQGITGYCQTCNQEVGANHIHGKTEYCHTCLREAGQNHVHDVTRLCMDHEIEHAPDHVHGTTVYCRQCHRDAGEGHKHGKTEWCWICTDEMEWPHCHH